MKSCCSTAGVKSSGLERVMAAGAASCARLEINERQPRCLTSQLFQRDTYRRHAGGMKSQHGEPPSLWQPQHDRSGQPTPAEQYGIKLIWPIRRADHKDAALSGNAVDLCQQ